MVSHEKKKDVGVAKRARAMVLMQLRSRNGTARTREPCFKQKKSVKELVSKMRIFNVKYEEDRFGELRILIEEEQGGKELFYQGEFVVQYGSKHDVGRGFIREVAGGTQHDWHRLCWHSQVKLQEFVEPRKDQVRNELTL